MFVARWTGFGQYYCSLRVPRASVEERFKDLVGLVKRKRSEAKNPKVAFTPREFALWSTAKIAEINAFNLKIAGYLKIAG